VSDRILDRKVTVCDKCLQASCWHGVFMCWESKNAGTKDVTVSELRTLSRENPEWWFKNPASGAIDQHGLAEYEALT
jgi:hypothetical protein